MRGPDSLGRGWWRRNAWGLVAVVPAFALMIYAAAYDNIEQWQRGRPTAVPAAADGSVDFAGVRLRLVELAPATDLKRFDRSPFTPPDGVAVWRAVLEIESPAPDTAPSCKLELEDGAGNRYQDRPDELSRADTRTADCRPDDEQPPVSGRYRSVAYFATATGVEAVAVRVTYGSVDLVRYARLGLVG